jgi:hypothetical protein
VGPNLSTVEVKATEHPVDHFFVLDTKWHKRLAHSNVPSLLLVVDAKHNRLYYAWPSDEDVKRKSGVRTIQIRVTPIEGEVKEQIRERLRGADTPAPAHGRR